MAPQKIAPPPEIFRNSSLFFTDSFGGRKGLIINPLRSRGGDIIGPPPNPESAYVVPRNSSNLEAIFGYQVNSFVVPGR